MRRYSHPTLLVLLAAVVVATTTTAAAIVEDDPLVSDRPDFTESATTLGEKHRFFENDGLVPETALIVSVTLPTGATGISREKLQPVLLGAFGWELTDVFSLGGNLGWSHVYVPRNRDRVSTLWGTLSLGASLGSRLGLFIETFGFNREDIDGNATSFLDLGFTYLIHENLQLDARVGQGFNGLDEDWFSGVGIVTRI